MNYFDPDFQRKIQQQGLAILARSGKGFEFTNTFFPYIYGDIGPYYVHSESVMKSGNDYYSAIRLMADLVCTASKASGEEVDVIVGGEKRDWVFSGPVASFRKWPHTMLCKDGTIIGAQLKDRIATLIADTNNRGFSVKNYWIPITKKHGSVLRSAFFFVDRQEGGHTLMNELGLLSHAVVSLNAQAWDYLYRQNIISPQYRNSLQNYFEDKKTWASEMLKTDRGLRRLAALIQDPDLKTRGRGMKILEEGYPELRDELVGRLANLGVKLSRANI